MSDNNNNNNDKEALELLVSDLIIGSLDTEDPEEFWKTIDSVISLAVAATAYKFGDDPRGEIIEHIIGVVMDTYESQKHFHQTGSQGGKPKIH